MDSITYEESLIQISTLIRIIKIIFQCDFNYAEKLHKWELPYGCSKTKFHKICFYNKMVLFCAPSELSLCLGMLLFEVFTSTHSNTIYLRYQ